MLRRDPFGTLVRVVSRRAWITLAVVGALVLAGAALALRLEPSAGIDTLVDSDTRSFQANAEAKETFGDDAVIILVDGPLEGTLLTPDLARLRDLEGCLAGNAPASDPTVPDTCQEFAELRPAQVVYGPGTFLNQAAIEAREGLGQTVSANEAEAERLARAAAEAAARQGASPQEQERAAATARQLARQELAAGLVQQGLQYQVTPPLEITNPAFVEQIVFTDPVAERVPKERFAGFFPADDAALIQVRLRPDLTEAERSRAIEMIRSVVASERFQPERGAELVATGVPVVIEALADTVERSLMWLLLAAVLVMAGTLALVFRSRMRLLPLAIGLAAAGLTFGAVSLVGGSLTMASVAALPVLIGLAVDYAIQFQSRFNEVRGIGNRPPPAEVAAPAAAAAGGPTILSAGLATLVGFLVLVLSPVPMVRGFGLILMAGVALALLCALTVGFAALVRFSPDPGRENRLPAALARLRPPASRAGRTARRAGGAAAGLALTAGRAVARMAARAAGAMPLGAVRGAGGRVRRRAARASAAVAERAPGARAYLRALPVGALRLALERPRQVLAVGLALAVLGWAVDTQSEVVSDVRELVPQDLAALEDLERLQDATGFSGQIDVTITGEDLTDPAVIQWIGQFRGEVLEAHGYEEAEGCSSGPGAPELCPALALPDLPGTAEAGSSEEVRAQLDAIPPYFQQAVISPDRRAATLAFGIRLMPLDRQQEVIEEIREELDPPPGVDAELTGVPVLAAEANAALSAPTSRFGLLLLGLVAVFAVLLAVRRSVREAAVPLVPIAFATGWAGLLLFVLRVELNPMSAALGALVVAISTEFSVLLSARYREERKAGASPARAIDLAYGTTGRAVVASGTTAIAGFAVLAVPLWSRIEMLQGFGVATVVGLGVSLLGVLVALPAALIWSEEHGPFTARDLDPRRAAAALRRQADERRRKHPAGATPVGTGAERSVGRSLLRGSGGARPAALTRPGRLRPRFPRGLRAADRRGRA